MWMTPVWSPGGGGDWLGVCVGARAEEEAAAEAGEGLEEPEEETEEVAEGELEAPTLTFAPLTVVVNVGAEDARLGAGVAPAAEAAGEALIVAPLGPIAATNIDVTISKATSTTIPWRAPCTNFLCVMATPRQVGDAERAQAPSSPWGRVARRVATLTLRRRAAAHRFS